MSSWARPPSASSPTASRRKSSYLTLWSADKQTDPAAIGGYSIKVNLSPGNTVIIPVKADKLDLAHASLPAGLAIEPAPLP